MLKLSLCALLAVTAQTVAADEITPNGTARVVSLHFFVAEVCRHYYSVDRDLAFKFAIASAEIGNKMIGVKPFGVLAKKETSRRAKEIKITGAAQWCAYQRANLRQSGSTVFLD